MRLVVRVPCPRGPGTTVGIADGLDGCLAKPLLDIIAPVGLSVVRLVVLVRALVAAAATPFAAAAASIGASAGLGAPIMATSTVAGPAGVACLAGRILVVARRRYGLSFASWLSARCRCSLCGAGGWSTCMLAS
jgi:hypothetical protein